MSYIFGDKWNSRCDKLIFLLDFYKWDMKNATDLRVVFFIVQLINIIARYL